MYNDRCVLGGTETRIYLSIRVGVAGRTWSAPPIERMFIRRCRLNGPSYSQRSTSTLPNEDVSHRTHATHSRPWWETPRRIVVRFARAYIVAAPWCRLGRSSGRASLFRRATKARSRSDKCSIRCRNKPIRNRIICSYIDDFKSLSSVLYDVVMCILSDTVTRKPYRLNTSEISI